MSTKQPAPPTPLSPQAHLAISAVLAFFIFAVVVGTQYLSLRTIDWQLDISIFIASIFGGAGSMGYKAILSASSNTSTIDLVNQLVSDLGDLKTVVTPLVGHVHTGPSLPPVPPTQPPPTLSSFAARPWAPSAVTSALDPQATQLRPIPPSGSGTLSNPPEPLQPPMQLSRAHR